MLPSDDRPAARPSKAASGEPAQGSIEEQVEQWFSSHEASASLTRGASRRLAGFVRRMLEPPPPAGQYGPYLVGGKLGAGGMGTVYRARHETTGHQVALKMAPSGSSHGEALKREADALRRVLHPNIPRLLDAGEANGCLWVATDLIEGSALSERISEWRKGLSDGAPLTHTREGVRQIVRWFRDLAAALHELHQAGFVHRDIKPANVMIRTNGVPYLIDFGLAFEESEQDAVGRVLAGTFPYMSPEQWLDGVVDFDRRSDLYSLGVTFYEALCGRRASSRGSRAEVARWTIFGELPAPSRVSRSVPRTLDPIVLRATSKEASDRYATAEVLSKELESWLETGHGAEERLRLRTRVGEALRTPWAIIAFTALVLGIIAFLVARHVCESRACDAIEALLGQDPVAAADLALESVEPLGGRSLFERTHAKVLAVAARPILEDVLRRQALQCQETSGDARARVRRLREDRRLEASPVRFPDLILATAFCRLMDDAPAEAARLLDDAAREGITGPGFLRLRAAADRARGLPVPAELARAIAAVPASALSPQDLCLHALLSLWDSDPAANLELDRVHAELVRVAGLPQVGEPRFVRTLLAVLRLRRGFARAALRDFRALLHGSTEPSEHAAILAHIAWAAAASSPEALPARRGPDSRAVALDEEAARAESWPASDETMQEAVDAATKVHGSHPSAFNWICERVAALGPKACRSMATRFLAQRLTAPAEGVNDAFIAVLHLAMEEDMAHPSAMTRLFESYEALTPAAPSKRAEVWLLAARNNFVWALLRSAREEAAPELRLRLNERTRAAARPAISVTGASAAPHLDYQIRAALAFATQESINLVSEADRGRVRTEALALLEDLISPDRIADARGSSTDPDVRLGIERIEAEARSLRDRVMQ